MMRRIAVVCLVLLLSLSNGYRLRAQGRDASLIPSSVANRGGLTRAWFTQLQLAPGTQGSVDLCLHVSSTQAQTIFRVTSERGRVYSFSNRDLDVFGERLEVEGAEEKAIDKVELLKRKGIEAQIEQSTVPDITLYAATNSGMVHAINAETGQPLWVKGVGSMRYPTSAPAVTDERVALVNGQRLYILETENGGILEERRVVGGAAAGPAMSGDQVYLPVLNGQLKAYTIGPGAPTWLKSYPLLGRIDAPPTIAGERVVCANEEGVITVIALGERGVRSRFRLKNELAGSISYVPPHQILAMTMTGDLYSFDLASNQLMWRYVSGYRTNEPAAVVEDNVFVITHECGVLAVSAASGERLWPQSFEPAEHFVAATEERAYFTTNRKELVALNSATGQPVSRLSLNLTDRAFSNTQTDRIYILTENGALQCLHEQGEDLPTLHLVEAPQKTAEEKAKPEAKKPPASEGPAPEPKSPPEPTTPGSKEDENPFG